MNKKITFMLDMDGVCCDWVKAGLKSVGKEELIGTWRNGAKDLGQLTGLSYAEIWEKIDAEGSNWWRTLEEYSWFWELYNKLKERGDVVFCTSPSWDPNCHKGKLEWLHDRFGRSFRDYIFTNRKFYVAKDNTILIAQFAITKDDIKRYLSLLILIKQVLLMDRNWLNALVLSILSLILVLVKTIVITISLCRIKHNSNN